MKTALSKFGLDDKSVHSLFEKGKLKKYAPNKLLFAEGHICDSWIYLKSGVTRHYINTKEGKEITKNFTTEGNFVFYSLSSYLSEKPGYIQFETLTECEIVHWSKHDFISYTQKPLWSNFYLHLLKNIIIKKEEKEIALLRDDAKKRYSDFIATKGNLLNLIPHHYIASNLGMSPETLSRIRKSIP